ncbi:MAG: hypothetical protein ABEI78_01565, partial [Candidatus Nanohaloarchaea archaeon]
MEKVKDFNIDLRSFIIGFITGLGVIALPSYIKYYLFMITPRIQHIVIQGRWDLVLINIIAFLLFLIPLNYRRKADWKSYSIYTAFIISLFVEMYGIP